ncbi:MAG: MFS family permease [Crocinitomicaceae bacterium]|jgi:MFS family permease
MASNRQLLILLSLYIAQGLPFGFFTQAMPAIMRSEGVQLKYIGLMSLLALPWALKFLWAPFLDKYRFLSFPLRKGWILLANSLAVLSLLIFSTGDQSWWLNSGLVFTMLILLGLNIFAASQDISTDALAIETVPADKRGLLNGIQVSGYRIGMIIGGGAILAWLPVMGWQYAMWLIALLLVLASAPVLLMSNDTKVANASEADFGTDESIYSSWKGLFKRKGIWLWVGLLVLYKIGDSFGTAMLKPLMIDSGYQLQDVAIIMGTWGVSGGLIGAVIGALLVRPLGRYRALVVFALLQAVSLFLYGLYAQGFIPKDGFLILCIIEHITGAMATIGIFTVMMDYCREHHAGLDYSFQSCLIITSGLVAGSLSGFSVEAFGYFLHFSIAAALTLLGLVWVMIQRKFIVSVTSA